MQNSRLRFEVIPGLGLDGVPPDRIALSLVHPRGRIDIPIGAIRWIEAREEYPLWEAGKLWMLKSQFFNRSAPGFGG